MININPWIQIHNPLYLYGLNVKLSKTILEQFQGIRYVVMQGSCERAEAFANKMAETLFHEDMRFLQLKDLFPGSDYAGYRIGNILSVSHGMGSASVSILLHEISRVMYLAGNDEFEYIRIGTSGGIDVPAGVVVITDKVYQSNLVQGYFNTYLEKKELFPAHMNDALNQRILAAQPIDLPFKIIHGNSVSADDFYLGQARLDGATIASYDYDKRQEYFEKMKQLSIYNMEMESGAFASFCCRADIPATMIAVTIINRALGDQFDVSGKVLAEWAERAQQVVINYFAAGY